MHKFEKAETFRGHLQTTMGQPMVAAELHRPHDFLNPLPKVSKTVYLYIDNNNKTNNDNDNNNNNNNNNNNDKII